MHDLVIRSGTVVDGTGAPGRVADVAITDGVVTHVGGDDGPHVDGPARQRDRRRRRPRHARLRRRPHPLRRPGHLGRAAVAVVLARRHHRRHGQLRRGLRARRPRQARLADRADGGRRGHPRRRPVRGHPLGLGELPRVPRRHRRPPPRRRHRRPGPPRRGAGLRHGRPRRGQRARHPRGHRGDGRHRARRHPGRRARVLDLAHPRPPGHRRRARAGHVRGRGRAVRHRRRARRAGHRRVRAGRRPARSARTWPPPSARSTGCGGCPRRSAGPSPSPCCRTTPIPTSGAACSTSPARPRPTGVAVRPQVHGRTVSILLGFQTFHPFNFTAAWGETGVGLLPVGRAGAAHPGRARPAGAAGGRDRGDGATTRSSPASCTPTASTCSATRPTTSPARRHRSAPSPGPRASTCGRSCST